MKTNLVCNFFGSSGYVSHARGLANALFKLNSDIHIDTARGSGWEIQVNDAELQMLKNPYFKEGVTIAILLPHQWPLVLINPCKDFYGYVVWEGDKVPAFWEKHLNDPRVTGLLVPSQHVKDAILNTFKVKKPIYIIPHGVDPSLFSYTHQSTPKTDDPFIFVGCGGWAQGLNDRKGIQYLIKAYCEEFKESEKVELRLKINPCYCPPGWNLNNELKKLNLPKDRSVMHISTEDVPLHEMRHLYNGNCFVYPTMGEAFGLTAAEALACGLPVIYTNYGGQTSFCTVDNGWPLLFDLQEVTHDISYEGISWAVPRLDNLKKLMRHCFENKEECKQKGEKGAEWVKKNLTWDVSAIKLLASLK